MTEQIMLDGLTLIPVTIPDDPDAPGAASFRTAVDVRNRVLEAALGDDAVAISPAQALPNWREQTDEEVHAWLIHHGDLLIGRAML